MDYIKYLREINLVSSIINLTLAILCDGLISIERRRKNDRLDL